MIHSSYYKPRIFPVKGTAVAAEIDRAQSIDPTVSLNRERVEEIGRDGVVGYLKKSPTVGYRLSQYEYGNIEFWQKLIGDDSKGNAISTSVPITLSDFSTPYFDICAYLTDDDGTFKGTMLYPSLRPSGFAFNIGGPQDIIDRSFDFVGESAIIWEGLNKYYIAAEKTVGSAGDNTVDLSAIQPAEDPDTAGKYMFRVVRVRAGVTTELVETTDYTYSNSTHLVTLVDPDASDVIKVYYTSGTAPAVQFTNNDSDAAGLLGDCASIYLYVPGSGKPSSSDYIYRLQSVNIDVKFDREDLREIGNKDVVQRGVKNKTVTVTLGKIMEDFTVEEILRGQVADYGKIDVAKLADDVVLIVKVFSDNDKGTFKYGFKATGLVARDMKSSAGVNAYVKADCSLEGEDLTITADVAELGI